MVSSRSQSGLVSRKRLTRRHGLRGVKGPFLTVVSRSRALAIVLVEKH